MWRPRRVAIAALACGLALSAGSCGRDYVLNPGHNSPRDPQTPGAPGVPAQPGALTAEGLDATSVTLRWTMSDTSTIARYRVFVKGPSDASYRLADSSSIQRRTVSNLQTGALYDFRVAAVNVTGLEGPWSEAIAARPSALFIALNGNAEVTNSVNVQVSITAPGFNQVRLAASTTDLASAPYQSIPGGGSVVFALSGADGTKTVYGQFRDSNTLSESAIVSDDIRLDRLAQISSVTQDAGSIVKTAGDVIHFTLTSGETDGNATVDIGTARTGIRLYDDGTQGDAVAGDGTYETNYVVESSFDANSVPVTGHFTDRAGNTATPVAAAQLLTISNPPPPVTLQSAIAVGGGKVQLVWSQSGVSDFASYRVWHALTSPVLQSASRVLATTITNRGTTSYTTDSLEVGTSQRFVVEVLDTAGNGTPSNELSAVPTASPQPAPR